MAEPQGLDITQLLGAANEFKQANDKATQGLQSDYSAAQANQEANAKMQEILGDNSVIIQKARDTAALETQQSRVRAATSLGTNLKDSSEVLTALSGTISEQYAKREAALQGIEQKRSISIFDDPLGWIGAQFDINDDIRAHNIADERLSNATEQYQKLNQLTQSAAVTQNSIDEPLTTAAVNAASASTAIAAQMKANDDRTKGIIYNAEGVKAALSGAQNKFQIGRDIFGAQKQEQQINIALAHLDLSRQERADRLAKQGAEDESDAQQIAWINQGGKNRLGDSYTPLVPGTASAKTALALLKSNTPAGFMYQNDFLSGQTSFMVDPSGNHRQISTSAAHAIEMMARDIPIKFSPAQAPVVELLQQAAKNVATMAQQPGSNINTKDPKAYGAALNAETSRLIDEQSKKVSGPDNVFNIPSVGALITNPISGPALAQLPVVQKVLAPQLAAGNNLSDPNQAFGLIAKAVQDKTITYPQALEFTRIISTGVNANIEAKQFSSLGITPKYAYNVSVQTDANALFGGKEVVDLSKPDALGRALNKYMANQMNDSISGITPDVGGVSGRAGGFDYSKLPNAGPYGVIPESPSIYNRK